MGLLYLSQINNVLYLLDFMYKNPTLAFVSFILENKIMRTLFKVLR